MPTRTNQQYSCYILTWLVYLHTYSYTGLAVQELHTVNDNAIEQLLRFVQQLLFCIGQLIKEHTDFCLVLAANLPTTLYSARKILNIDWDNFVSDGLVLFVQNTPNYHMDENIVNDGRRTFAKTCDCCHNVINYFMCMLLCNLCSFNVIYYSNKVSESVVRSQLRSLCIKGSSKFHNFSCAVLTWWQHVFNSVFIVDNVNHLRCQ